MLKIQDKTGKTVMVLKDDTNEPELLEKNKQEEQLAEDTSEVSEEEEQKEGEK